MKNQLPTYVLNAIAKYVKPRLNNFVHEVMKNNQISRFTTPSPTTTDDISKMDLKLKLQNKMHQNKSHETYNTHHKLYDTLYESITLDQEALDAQDIEPSFNKRSHDDQDPPNDREGETRNERRKDASQPSYRSSKKDKALMVLVQENTPAEQPQDHEEYYVRERPHVGWFTKKLGLTDAAKRRTTWFDLLIKSDIDQNEDHILGPSTVAVAKKLKELIQKDDPTIADLEVLREAQWNNGEGDVSKPRSFKRHMSKSTKPYISFYNTDFYYLVNVSTGEKYATSLTKHFPDRWSKKIYCYQIEALNSIHHWEDGRQEFFKAEINNRSPDKVYSNKRIISVVRVNVKKKWAYGFLKSIVVTRSDKKEYEFSNADLLRLNFNNALLLFIKRVVIQNRVEDIHLGVESYQTTLNFTKPKFYFEGIDQKIPYTMSGTEKGVVYLN
ncbi:hypothetical protein Tco_1297542 [Tanacetum coccineum]